MSENKLTLNQYQRRISNEIRVGGIKLGGSLPIRVQSMTTTDTNDVESSVAQCKRIIDAGGELVRLTTQGIKEGENIQHIKKALVETGYPQPVVADVHFNAKVAFITAEFADKVRINPGNFVDPVKRFETFTYTDEAYREELDKIEAVFVPFLETCKKHHTAIRIGVNHGSLSDRIMSRYGDTAEGMVESCMEFLRIAVRENFADIVISVKASNTRIMVQTVRLLVKVMADEGMAFPLHLGVTEAGEGEDGRIKSAAGIGALLADGIGDTIRVSLSEDPEMEIPVCQLLRSHFEKYDDTLAFKNVSGETYFPYAYQPRKTHKFFELGGGQVPVVAVGVKDKIVYIEGSTPEWVYDEGRNQMVHVKSEDRIPVENLGKMHEEDPGFIRCTMEDITPRLVHDLKGKYKCILYQPVTQNVFTEVRNFILQLEEKEVKHPVVVEMVVERLTEETKVTLAADLGGLLIDGLLDGLLFKSNNEDSETLTNYGLSLLQATRARFSKTEYISCPGCGRTLFNLQSTIAKVKAATSHLKGLKIAVMGCIVNGPGEMADADFGYVGAGKNRISLYKGKECIKKGIPQEDAIPELIDMLKTHNCWVEPSK